MTVRDVAEEIIGTCKTLNDYAEELGMDVTDLESALLDYDVERCEGCDWWYESSELVCEEDEDKTGLGEDCR